LIRLVAQIYTDNFPIKKGRIQRNVKNKFACKGRKEHKLKRIQKEVLAESKMPSKIEGKFKIWRFS
jgi:hypothetical protein